MSIYLQEELAAFEAHLRKQYGGRTRFERQTAQRLFMSGGKRLRPSMTLSAARLGSYDRNAAFPAAAAVELIHTASLVHDDIVDHAQTRRGVPTVSSVHGDAVAVYMGDYLLAQSLLALSCAGVDERGARRLAGGIRAMCAGEIEQYFSRRSVPSAAQYLKRVMRKTALLFSAACALGGHCAQLPDTQVKALARFGFSYGVAFQIKDDILDLLSGESLIGKPVLRDISEGVVTLPLLYAIEADPAVRKLSEAVFAGKEDARALAAATADAGGIAKAADMARRYAAKCRVEVERMPDRRERAEFDEYVAALVDT